jgi:hypothetical protein
MKPACNVCLLKGGAGGNKVTDSEQVRKDHFRFKRDKGVLLSENKTTDAERDISHSGSQSDSHSSGDTDSSKDRNLALYVGEEVPKITNN